MPAARHRADERASVSRKIIQTPTEVILIYEGSGTTVREIYLDGRALPKDPEPWYNGYSVGRWEGDTLVVETTGLMDEGWLDVRGSPITNAGKITERFRRVKYGYIELEETIDDPKVYTKPFTAKLYWRLTPDTQLIEFVCIDKDAAHYVGAVANRKRRGVGAGMATPMGIRPSQAGRAVPGGLTGGLSSVCPRGGQISRGCRTKRSAPADTTYEWKSL